MKITISFETDQEKREALNKIKKGGLAVLKVSKEYRKENAKYRKIYLDCK